jgi:hypothetical protein
MGIITKVGCYFQSNRQEAGNPLGERMMPETFQPTPSRRSTLRFSLAALTAGLATPAVAGAMADPDAELIRVCHQFAEAELENWYRYVTAPVDVADKQDRASDWDTYRWIVSTPAVTAEGWQAKALAYSAWDEEAYWDEPEFRDPKSTFLLSLLRDIVAQPRNAIIARLAAEYGPLPDGYTAEGIFLGPSPEEKARMKAEQEAREAERLAKQEAELAEARAHPKSRDEILRSIARAWLQTRDECAAI